LPVDEFVDWVNIQGMMFQGLRFGLRQGQGDVHCRLLRRKRELHVTPRFRVCDLRSMHQGFQAYGSGSMAQGARVYG